MNRILELRKNLHLTQAQFAELCDVAIVSIARYETGGKVNLTNAVKIAKACNVSLDYVLETETKQDRRTMKESGFGHPDLNLSEEEKNLIEDYRKISRKGQHRIRETLDELMIVYKV